MFEVGFTEIILILGLALLVLGPEKLPALAEKVGRWTGRARAMARQLRTQLEHEVTMEELAKSRPMQPAPQPAEPPATNEVHAQSNEAQSNEGQPKDDAAPAASGPGLDLDRMVSGIEPPPASDSEAETRTAKSAQ
ncbi:MAG: Sec-independent protein translocase protein TatB [Steroidobacteraceae bacterium]